MPVKFSHAEAVTKYEAVGLTLLDTYTNRRTRVKTKCNKCNTIYMSSPGCVFGGHRCKICVFREFGLSDDEIDQVLETTKRSIQRIGKSKGNHIRIEWKCLICNHQWFAPPTNIIVKETGCKNCTGTLKLTNKIIDERFKNKNIKRISNYINKRTSIKFQCLNQECNYIWDAIPGNIMRGGSCPKCSNQFRITNEDIDAALLKNNRQIKRLTDRNKNSDNKVLWECLLCNYQWSCEVHRVIGVLQSGCWKCSGRMPLTNEEVDKRLEERKLPFKRLEDIINAVTKINFKCLTDNCNYIWNTQPSSILNNNYNCPKCSKNIELTNEIVDERLEQGDRNIIRIGTVCGNKNKILWKCKTCQNEWSAIPNDIFSKGAGCPACKNKNEKLIYQYLKCYDIQFIHQFKAKLLINNLYKNYRIDFYLPTYNLFIEYNGHQHYMPVIFGSMNMEIAAKKFEQQKQRDQYIRDLCKEHHINLIEIDGRKYFGDKLKQYILNLINSNFRLCHLA